MNASPTSPPQRQEAISEAARYLERNGVKVLDQRWQAPGESGQLDLIAVERDVFAVAAVSYATPTGRANLTEISAKKARLLRRLGVAWMNAHGVRYDRLRVDAVAVLWEGTGGYTIQHVREAG
jgi:putative endonuclease